MQPPTDQSYQAATPTPELLRSTPASGAYRVARRIGVTVVGSTVLAIGVILLVTPGPAFVVIPVGLGILSIEFEWARRWLRKVKEQVGKVMPGHDKGTPSGS